MKKKKTAKNQVDTIALKKLIKKLAKVNKLTKSTALVALSLVLVVVLFNYKNISNYFNGISKAAIINITTEMSLLPDNAREDELRDSSEMGVAYMSNVNENFLLGQIRFYYFEPTGSNETISLLVGNLSDFDFIKTHGIYVIYTSSAENPNRIYWHNLSANPFDSLPIAHEVDDYDHEGDIWNGKIVFIRSANGEKNIWQYDIGATESEQITFFDSDKSDIRYNDDKVVWVDYRNGNPDIYMYDFNNPNSEGTQITNAISDQSEPVFHDNKIVWTDNRNGDLDIYMYDLDNPIENGVQVTFNDKDQYSPDIYRNQIVWEDLRNDKPTGFYTGNSDIYMYDLTTQTEIPISTNDMGDQAGPNIVQNKVIWTYIYGSSPSGLPQKDLFISRFDELNLLNPENDVLFQFKDINFEWDYFTANNIDPTVFKIRGLLNNIPFTPPNGIPVGTNPYFLLASNRIESYPDGIFEWAVLPMSSDEWDAAESRLVVKETAADLIVPNNGTIIEIHELFDWEEIPGAINYVAKIDGFLDGGESYYFPLNTITTEFVLPEVIYNMLKPGIAYKWAITGTGLAEWLPTSPNHPDYAQMATLYFNDGWTFSRE